MQEYKRLISQAGGSRLSRREAWAGIVSEWQASGLGVSAFCQQHGLRAKRLYVWRARLQRSDRPADDPPGSPPGQKDTHRRPVAGFARLEVMAEPADAALEVHVGGGRVLVRGRCDPGMLSTVLRVLKESPC